MEHMDVLYKYVKASLATTCLPEVGDGTLRATQPGALNDPFECGVLPGRHGRDDEIARVLTSLNGSTPVSPANVQDARIRYGSLYLRELLAKQLSERFGIVSFASDPRHPLMWAHYTGDGSGFVIGYDKSEISGLARRADCLQPVYYQDRPTPVLAFEALSENNVNAILSFKSHHWLYEDEWRLIVELSETIGTGQVDQFGYSINLLRVPNEAVVSVYYTERTPSQLVDPVAVRLAKPNNRYGVKRLTKLVLSETGYGYMDGRLQARETSADKVTNLEHHVMVSDLGAKSAILRAGTIRTPIRYGTEVSSSTFSLVQLAAWARVLRR